LRKVDDGQRVSGTHGKWREIGQFWRHQGCMGGLYKGLEMWGGGNTFEVAIAFLLEEERGCA